MDFAWSEEVVQFRKDLRAFLDEELPVFRETFDMPVQERDEFSRAFAAKLAAREWLTPSWPREYGGLDQSLWHQLVMTEEMLGHGEPRAGQYMNVNWVGPAIINAGTDEQKARFLPPISRGEILFCQGFSEPDAGSDLGALRTRARREGDVWVITGEKIWTTNAGTADFIFLLARTATTSPPSAGISIFLVPTNLPGIRIDPIHASIHDGDFHQVVFDEVRVPVDAMLGQENEAFAIVRSLLANERAGQTRYYRASLYLDWVVDWASDRGLMESSWVRHTVARARAQCDAARILMYRFVDARDRRSPDADLYAFEYRASTVRAERAVADAAFELQGAEGLPDGSLTDGQYEWAVTAGIAGGTYEIQLETIARKGLGLPRK